MEKQWCLRWQVFPWAVEGPLVGGALLPGNCRLCYAHLWVSAQRTGTAHAEDEHFTGGIKFLLNGTK